MADVALRLVEDGDLPHFFAWQADEASWRMAAVAPRDADAFAEHWAKHRTAPGTTLRTVLVDGEVAGHVVSWPGDEGRMVGYALGPAFWGRGIATAALRLFLDEEEPLRPLRATVAEHNLASRRVLEKAGFVLEGTEKVDDGLAEALLGYRLDRQPARSSTSS